jgi:putative ABC transport system permease protein
VVGGVGSRLDLTLDALYFQTVVDPTVPYGRFRQLAQQKRGTAIPLHLEFTAQGFPVVGTNLDYFRFRQMRLAGGEWLATLGQCVLGAHVARELNLGVGDTIKSDRENDLDIASNPPLIMHIAGILAPQGTADDNAVFVDVKTAWIIAGLGHGHDAVDAHTPDELVLRREDGNTMASAAVASYLEITDANRASFHFHGDPNTFPISAILFVPYDQRARDLVEGTFQNDPEAQFLVPIDVIKELMSMVFRIKALFDANSLVIATATGLLLLLVIWLSSRLRQREMETMFKIGCGRGTMAMLQAAELGIILFAALLIVGVLIGATSPLADALMRSLLFRSG